MSIKRWHILTIAQHVTPTGYIIIVTTNAYCHLFMRWSKQPYRVHLRPQIIRGLAQRFLPDYCFTVYQDNEQEETGDSLVHTFIKEPWSHCETRYFYFWGTIDDGHSPSTTCAYTKHRFQPPPPPYALVTLEPWGWLYTPEVWTYLFTEPWTS